LILQTSPTLSLDFEEGAETDIESSGAYYDIEVMVLPVYGLDARFIDVLNFGENRLGVL
jgi:hypothetical protein